MQQASRSLTRMLAPIGFGLLVPLATGSFLGCKKDEPPPPLPSAAPAATPTPPAALELAPEEVPVDAGVDAGKKVGGGGGGQSMKKCCQALLQNAESAPEPNKTYMKQAGAMCQSLAGTGQGQASILAAISGALRGAGMPSACR